MGSVTTTYMFQPVLETLDRADLRRLQLDRLQKILAYVWSKVPYYRERFTAAGVRPDDLHRLEDLSRFPFTVKDDLRHNYPFGLFAVPLDQVPRIHASSGTTGKPTVVGYTQGDLNRWADLMARSFACAGARPGDILHNAHGYGLFTGGLGAHYGAERLGMTVIPISGGQTERQVMLMRDFGVTVMCGTPSYVLNLAETAERLGIDLRSGPLHTGTFGAEPWSEALRRQLQDALGIKAMDLYGLSEVMGPGVAIECRQAQDGLHAWEDHFLLELIDPETLEPARPGEPGELVITTLTKEALPMIRYRTRDITRLSDEPCPCGRTHRRLMRITGRDDDMLIIRGVNLFPSQVEAVLVGLPGLAPHYQLVVSRDGALDRLAIEVEAAAEIAGDPAALAQARRAVQHQVKTMIGVSCEVVVKAPGEVPRSEGKAVRVRDLRPATLN